MFGECAALFGQDSTKRANYKEEIVGTTGLVALVIITPGQVYVDVAHTTVKVFGIKESTEQVVTFLGERRERNDPVAVIMTAQKPWE